MLILHRIHKVTGLWAINKDEWMEHYKEEKPTLKLRYGNENQVDTSNPDYNSIPYDGEIDEGLVFDRNLDIPNILYCPEYIFANKIAALDVNFINPGTYKNAMGDTDDSIAGQLTKAVASWYKALRNVAIVGLLSILVYIGIRILIGSTAQDKAKYKERLKDWLVGLCLLFAMHYIMAGVMMINETITENLSGQLEDNSIYVRLDGYDGETYEHMDITFKTNYMGYIRLMAQSPEIGDKLAYIIMYVALIIFTIMFTITYLKRVLYMAFFTMIAPLVAMTYPLDKLADGHAQGFNMWFREYMLNAIIQPVHLIIYMLIMGSVMNLAVKNPLYAIVAMAFLIPAEKFIKRMFRFDKGETTSALGAVAGGALAMKAVNGIGRFSKGLASGKGGNGGNDRIRTQENPEIIGKRGKNKGTPSPDEVIANEDNSISMVNGNNNIPELSSGSRNSVEVGSTALSTAPSTARNLGTAIESTQNNVSNQTQGNVLQQNNRDVAVRQKPTIPTNIGGSNNTNNYSATQKPTRFTRLKSSINKKRDAIANSRVARVASALGNKGIRYANKIPGRLKDTAIKGIKNAPRFAVKVGGRAAGIATTGAIAAGAAITSGDAKTAASMIGAGTLIGNNLGGAVGNRLSDNAGRFTENVGSTISDTWYTDNEKEQRKQAKKAKYDAEWKQKEEHYKYLRNKGMNDMQAKDFLEDANTQRFLNAGVTDINSIYNARKMMDESNGRIKIEGAVARAQLAKNVSSNFKNSDSEQISFADNMKRKNANIDTEQLIKEIIKINKRED